DRGGDLHGLHRIAVALLDDEPGDRVVDPQRLPLHVAQADHLLLTAGGAAAIRAAAASGRGQEHPGQGSGHQHAPPILLPHVSTSSEWTYPAVSPPGGG